MAATTQNTSNIVDTYSVSEFKTLKGASNRDLVIKESKKTGKFFMTIGSTSVGPVSDHIDYSLPLQVIEFEDGTYCLCNKGEGATTVAVL